jgi:hypothetical protein
VLRKNRPHAHPKRIESGRRGLKAVFFNTIQRQRSRYTASRNDRQPRTAETFDLNKPDWRADAAQRRCLIDLHPVRQRRSCLGILRNGSRHNHLAAATLMCCCRRDRCWFIEAEEDAPPSASARHVAWPAPRSSVPDALRPARRRNGCPSRAMPWDFS